MKKTLYFKIYITLTLISSIILSSCGNIHQSPDGAIVAFIVAAEQRDMTKAWNILSPDLQAYYNNLGEKMRKSGRGALENEIAKITKFRSARKDYRLQKDTANISTVRLLTVGGPVHIIETVNIEGDFKIKDEKSLRSLLDGITAEEKKKEGY